MLPHLPRDVTVPLLPVAVRPLIVELGEVVGHRLLLLSIEDWGMWADLRFARIATPGASPLARRIPLAADWQVWLDGEPAEVVDVAGRGERVFSNGELRIRPAPRPGSRMRLRARLSGEGTIDTELDVPA
jgi:hypothetical protein